MYVCLFVLKDLANSLTVMVLLYRVASLRSLEGFITILGKGTTQGVREGTMGN